MAAYSSEAFLSFLLHLLVDPADSPLGLGPIACRSSPTATVAAQEDYSAVYKD